ncbi:MAG: hypothetical protein ABW148_15540 [Sedimenticola sp.]
MKELIKKHLSQFSFRRIYGFSSVGKYKQFINYVEERLEQTIDKETNLSELSFSNSWKDQGGNIHVSIRGKITRRNENADIGAEIVLLKRLKTFRGTFWSHLNPKSDSEIYSEAKTYFHAGKYAEFLSLSRYIRSAYSSNRVFNKMSAIAERRV